MKRILWVLVGMALASAPASRWGDPVRAACVQTGATGQHADRAQRQKDRAEERKTSHRFHVFITADVARNRKIENGETLYYTGFRNADEAMLALLGLITPSEAKIRFGTCYEYETGLMRVKWKENAGGGISVKDGFARIEVVFKKNAENYTVVFCAKGGALQPE